MQSDLQKIARQSHWEILSGSLSSLRYSHQFADVTFICDGHKTVQAHKAVLSACSPVLASIFRSTDDNEDAIINLDGVEHTDLETLLDFVYLGQSLVEKEEESELNTIAKIINIYCFLESMPLLREGKLDMSRRSTSLRSENKDPRIKEDKIMYEYEIKDEIPYDVAEDKSFDWRRDSIDENNGMKCSKCEKCYQTKGGLRSHFENVHNGRKWTCEKCDMKFTSNDHKKIHIQTKHEGLYFQCSQCDATFGTKAALKTHVKGKHLGMKYKCPVCSKEFVQNGVLKIHLEGIHYGMRYPCKFCDYTTHDPSNTNKHMKKVHKQSWIPKTQLDRFVPTVEKNDVKRHLFNVWNGKPISI